MKVYVVTQTALLGPVAIVGVYADEIDALREANTQTNRKMAAYEVIPAGESAPA